MKIVVCIWSFFGGGAERVAVLLANALVERGMAVKLYYARHEGPNLALLGPGVDLVCAPLGGPGAYLQGLRRLIAEWRPDVIQTHQTTRNALALLAHLSVLGRARRAIVAIEHGEMQQTVHHNRGLGLKVFFALTRVLYPLADCIISVSENVRQSVAAHLAPLTAHHRVMDNPVIFPGMKPLKALAPGHPWLEDAAGIPTLVSLGRLEPQKNYALLIEAFALLRKKRTCRLIIFGEGSLRASLEAQITEAGLGSDVDLPGYTTNPFAVLRAADLFVLSSHWEGLPTVAIEALACGTRVVSTENSTGVRQIVATPEAGELVPCNDVLALSAAMGRVLNVPASGEALTRLVSAYCDTVVADEHIALYRELLAAKGAGHG